MRYSRLLNLAIIVVLSFFFIPAKPQNWQNLIKKVSRYQLKNDTVNANIYADKALQKANAVFGCADARYKQTLELYLKTATGEKEDSLIAIFRKIEIDYLLTANLSWEDLSKKAKEYWKRADLVLSKTYAEKALAKAETVYGKQHPNYAASLNDLGLAYFQAGNYRAAEPLYTQALEIQKNALGQMHPDYALTLVYLADLKIR